MKTNLNVDHFANGDLIPEVQTNEQWVRASDQRLPAWCYYNNDSGNGKTSGKLYNWFAVSDPRGLAIKGWHVPSDEEWAVLTTFLGGEDKAGIRLEHDYGWDVKGLGLRGFDGSFQSNYSDLTNWWSSTMTDRNSARLRQLKRNFIMTQVFGKGCGLSVRCIKDSYKQVEEKRTQANDQSDFTKIYSGSIDNKYSIEMTLTKTGTSLNGTYKYQGNNSSLKLKGTIDDDGNFVVHEFNDHDDRTGVFKGQMNGVTASGRWSNADGNKLMPFIISEQTNKTVCSQQQIKNEESGENEIVKTCTFRNFKSVSKGVPNYKGQYNWDYELQIKRSGGYVKANNYVLFNQSQDRLLSLINKKIQEVYHAYASDTATKDCFTGNESAPNFTIDQLGIDFNDDQINFHASFGLGGVCTTVGGTIVSFSIDEIKPYLN